MSPAFPPEPLRQIVEEVATLLKERGESISVAETAAGGLISAALLSYPGASSFYAGGLTLYTLESRKAFAGWTDKHTAAYRGPTPEIVLRLADNVRQKLGSTYCVSESGTAGPTGGKSRNRTPGYVAVGVVGVDGDGKVRKWSREGETGTSERGENMVAFAVEGLELVRDVLRGGLRGDGEVEEGKL